MTDATPTNIGKYVIEGVIGEGAMGTVYRAKDSVIGRTVAIKVMNAAIARDQNHRQRFLREAQAAGSLQHPNVVTIFDLGEIEGHLFIAMEFLRGADLEKLMAGTDTLKLQSKLDIVVDVLMGLSYAHSNGIVHRDIKPANIRVGDDGKAKIMDFGVAHLASSDMTRTGLVVGTPSYMAPEQVTGGKTVPGTDIFAVGAVLYHLLTGTKPFEGPTLQSLFYRIVTDMPPHLDEVRPGLPPALNSIIQKAMAKDPADRYASALEMANDIISVRAGLSGNPYASTASLTASAVSIEEKFTPPPVPVATAASAPAASVGSATVTSGFPWKPVSATAAAAILLFAGWHFIKKDDDAPATPVVAASEIPATIGAETAPITIPAPAESATAPPAAAPAAQPETAATKADTKSSANSAESSRRERAAAAARVREEQKKLERQREEQRLARLREAQKKAARTLPNPTVAEQKRVAPAPAPVISSIVQPPRDTQPRPVTVVPVPVPPPPPPPPAPARNPELQPAAAREGITAAVSAYARAIESRDMDAVRRVYPGITADQARGFQQFFQSTRSINVTFRVTDVETAGTTADARLVGTYVYVTGDGKTERQPVSFGASLRYDGANWQLRSVR